jgi:long-chain fatty acid transport protein
MKLLSIAALAIAANFYDFGGEAKAGGFYIADIGARALGRGGAFVAAPDDVLAVHYNPAGLSFLRGMHVSADVSVVAMDLSYERRCPCVTDPSRAQLDSGLSGSFTPVRAETGLVIPFVGVAYGIPELSSTVALAAGAPNSGRHRWGELSSPETPGFIERTRSAPQRYSVLSAQNLELNYALAFAFSPLRGLRFGAALIGYTAGADQTLHLWANSATFTSEPEDPRFDVPLRVKFQQDFALNWALGASWEPIENLAIGASFRAKRKVNASGTIDVHLPMLLLESGARVEGNEIDVELQTAAIGRAGVQYTIPEILVAEAAVVVEWWSVHQEIVVTPKNIRFSLGSSSQDLSPIVLRREWRDTYSLRFGTELKALEPWVAIRAGYFFEPSAISPERVDASRVDLDKHGFSLGFGTELFAGTRLEASGMFIHFVEADVTASGMQIKAPLVPPLGSTDLMTSVANGRYGGHYLIGTMSLSVAL